MLLSIIAGLLFAYLVGGALLLPKLEALEPADVRENVGLAILLIMFAPAITVCLLACIMWNKLFGPEESS